MPTCQPRVSWSSGQKSSPVRITVASDGIVVRAMADVQSRLAPKFVPPKRVSQRTIRRIRAGCGRVVQCTIPDRHPVSADARTSGGKTGGEPCASRHDRSHADVGKRHSRMC